MKNINSTHRIDGIATQHGLAGARQSAIDRAGTLPKAHIIKKDL